MGSEPTTNRESRGWYLWGFESFAQWLGATVEPGPTIIEI